MAIKTSENYAVSILRNTAQTAMIIAFRDYCANVCSSPIRVRQSGRHNSESFRVYLRRRTPTRWETQLRGRRGYKIIKTSCTHSTAGCEIRFYLCAQSETIWESLRKPTTVSREHREKEDIFKGRGRKKKSILTNLNYWLCFVLIAGAGNAFRGLV